MENKIELKISEFKTYDFTYYPTFEILEISGCENSTKALEIIKSEKFQNDFKNLKNVTGFVFKVHNDLNAIKGRKFNTKILNFERPLVVAFVEEKQKSFEIFWKTKSSNFKNISLSTQWNDYSGIKFMNVIDFLMKFLINEVTNDRSAILSQYNYEADDTVNHSLTELVDHQDDNLLLVSIKYNNMDAYNFLKTPSFYELEVYKKGKTVETSTINVAFSCENVELFYDLLKKEMKFPKLFKHKREQFEEKCPKLKELVEDFERMHEYVENFNDKEECDKLKFLLKGRNNQNIPADELLRDFARLLKKYEGKKFCYNAKNVSLMQHANDLGKVNLCNIFIDQKMEFSSDAAECEKFRHDQICMSFKKVKKFKDDYISQLIKVSSLKINEENLTLDQTKTLKKVLKYLDTIKFIKPILEVIAACSNFLLVFDTESDDIQRNLMDGYEGTLGVAFYVKGELMVGAKSLFDENTMKTICDETFNFDKNFDKKIAQVIGTLVHEFCHYAMYLVFRNHCRPYFRKDYNKFIKIVANLSSMKFEDENEKRIIGMVFTKYKRESWHAEAIVRVPQIYAEFSHLNDRLNELKNKFKDLFQYFEDDVLNAVTNSVAMVEKIKNEKVKFSDLSDYLKNTLKDIKVNFHGNNVKLVEIIGDDDEIERILSKLTPQEIKEMLDLRNNLKINNFEAHEIDNLERKFVMKKHQDQLTIHEILDKALDEKIIFLQGHKYSGKTNAMIKLTNLLIKEQNEKWILVIRKNDLKSKISFNKFQINAAALTNEEIKLKLIEFFIDKILKDTKSEFEKEIFKKLFLLNNVIILWDNFKHNEIKNIVCAIWNYSGNEQWITIDDYETIDDKFIGTDIVKFAPINREEIEKFFKM